jgi:hypothetical protein
MPAFCSRVRNRTSYEETRRFPNKSQNFGKKIKKSDKSAGHSGIKSGKFYKRAFTWRGADISRRSLATSFSERGSV